MSTFEHVVLPGWTVDQARREWPSDGVVVAQVDDQRGLGHVLEVAASGVPVVAVTSGSGPLVDQLVDGLRRIGSVRLGPPPDSAGAPDALTEEGAALLGLLAQGRTLREAAAHLGMSLRTADRRLARARDALGAATTAEAVVAYAARSRGSAADARPTERGAVRLVGRQSELDRLLAGVGDDEPCLVVGEGGIGKTALLKTVMAAVGRPTHAAAAQAALRWKPYWPLARAVGKPELTGDAESVAAQVEAIVGPDLLVVDDVHLADEGTVAVLAALSGRISVLTAARPGPGDDVAGALPALQEAGFTVVTVDPLPGDQAADLARGLAPQLSAAEVTAVVAGAGGLPLLVEFLCHGDETATRGRGLVPSVAALSASALDSALHLSLAARPLPADGETTDLVAAGVAQYTDAGEVRIRHALVADAVLAAAPRDSIAAAHRDLARTAQDAGTAARHWWSAGEAARAYASALSAADASTTSAERAEHLRLAALAAPRADAVMVRLRAAGELSAAGRHGDVVDLLADLPTSDAEPEARADALRARAHWHLGDAPKARAVARAGLARVVGSGTAEELALLIETVRCEALSLGPQPDHEAMLDRASEIAERGHLGRAAVLNTKGIVEHLRGRGGVAEWLQGIDVARSEEDLDTLLRCSNNIITWHESAGDHVEGLRLAREMAQTAAEHGLGQWHAQFLAMSGNLLMHQGRYPEALADLQAAEAGAVDAQTRGQARLARAMIHTDLGLFDATAALIGTSPEAALADERLDSQHRFQHAALALYMGRPQLARDLLAEQERDAMGEAWFGMAVDAWAAYELGVPIPAPPAPDEVPVPFVAGLQHEVEALHALPTDPATAATLFDAAVSVGRPWVHAPSVRAHWAAGEARRLAGASDAIDVLLAAEAEAARSGLEPILVRVRRSLRLAGVRRAAPRAIDRSGLVTQRERTVMDLVAAGATQAEIARRLGVGRPTVRRLIDSARAKLGTTDRISTAAALTGR